MGMMRGRLGLFVLVMFGSHAMMMSRFLMMFGGGVVMGAGRMLVRHRKPSFWLGTSTHQSREIKVSGLSHFRESRGVASCHSAGRRALLPGGPLVTGSSWMANKGVELRWFACL